jgi:hypothetical protein
MVTTTLEAPEWASLERRFQELFFADLAMVEDKDVAAAMVCVSDALKNYKEANDSNVHGVTPEQKKSTEYSLKNNSRKLAEAIRDSLEYLVPPRPTTSGVNRIQ